MSDIPRARQLITAVRRIVRAAQVDLAIAEKYLARLEPLLTREKPVFRARNAARPMTRKHVEAARRMRKSGASVEQISKRLGFQIGRISEAVSGKRDGV